MKTIKTLIKDLKEAWLPLLLAAAAFWLLAGGASKLKSMGQEPSQEGEQSIYFGEDK